MSYFSSDFIEQVRQASDIVSLISRDTNLKSRGDQNMGICPFPEHDEKTPSFSVSSSKQVYYCFGCQKSGDVFSYVSEQKGFNFSEAVEYLADQAHIPIPKQYEKNQGKAQSLKKLFQLNKKVSDFYHQHLLKLPSNHSVWNYLNERDYTKNTIEDFKIGYAPSGSTLFSYLNEEERALALKLGLLNKNSQGERYDTYRKRLIFPITSARHQIQGFGARVLDDSLPKYINSKESEIFQKGSSFYGLDLSARFLKEENSALVVEGYTDFISLFQSDVKNLVATLGTALTSQHAELLKKYVKTVILIFDGDKAGQKAAERSLPLLLNAGLEVKSIKLPDNRDPDDFIKAEGKEGLQACIYKSEDLFFQILQKKLKEVRSKGQHLSLVIEEMSPYLQATKNPTLLSFYQQRILDIFGNDAHIVRQKLNELSRASQKPAPNQAKTSSKSSPKPLLSRSLLAERMLLALCLDSASFLQKFLDEKNINLIKTSFMLDLFEELESRYRQNPENFDRILSSMTDLFSDSHLLFKEAYIPLKEGKLNDLKKAYDDCVLFLKKQRDLNEANEILTEVKIKKDDNPEKLKKILELTKKRLNI